MHCTLKPSYVCAWRVGLFRAQRSGVPGLCFNASPFQRTYIYPDQRNRALDVAQAVFIGHVMYTLLYVINFSLFVQELT